MNETTGWVVVIVAILFAVPTCKYVDAVTNQMERQCIDASEELSDE